MFGNGRQIFLRRCAWDDRHRKNDFFRFGGGIFEGGKQDPSDFASDSGKILMDGGYAETSADICIVEAAEAEILRQARKISSAMRSFSAMMAVMPSRCMARSFC